MRSADTRCVSLSRERSNAANSAMPRRASSTPAMPPLACGRRQLCFERVLLGTGEVPRRGRLVGIQSHPLSGKTAEEVVNGARLRMEVALNQRRRSQQGGEQQAGGTRWLHGRSYRPAPCEKPFSSSLPR